MDARKCVNHRGRQIRRKHKSNHPKKNHRLQNAIGRRRVTYGRSGRVVGALGVIDLEGGMAKSRLVIGGRGVETYTKWGYPICCNFVKNFRKYHAQ